PCAAAPPFLGQPICKQIAPVPADRGFVLPVFVCKVSLLASTQGKGAVSLCDRRGEGPGGRGWRPLPRAAGQGEGEQQRRQPDRRSMVPHKRHFLPVLPVM